ncbi:hypothetical protein M4D58_26300 [Brevibacillus borstelensis]|uniref:hypothetical protein n=1 Tax=Brevibacillus borstelensis TaxID=45462 RepID=UPI002042165C|nr:hypothetical protein [Brevibacillus borstelensis]MCM3594065.1 hypothetical protein [Brevibacillus borstelensis]
MLVEKKIKNTNISVVQQKDYYSIPLDELNEMFADYQQRDIIQAASFEDDVWYLYNEKIKRRVIFQLDEIKFNRTKKNRSVFSFEDIIHALKGYVLYKLDVHPVESLSEQVSFLKKVIEETDFFHIHSKKVLVAKKVKKDTNYYKLVHVLIEFLEYFPIAESEEYLNLLYYQSEAHSKSNKELTQRELGIFGSIFELGDALDTFWEHCSEDEKEEFYPIKLWWEITTTIPLRVSEFIVTPYDCLSEEEGFYYLTVRRTDLKGNATNVTHKVEEDYTLQKIRINEALYRLIQAYRDLVDDYDFIPNYFYQGYQHTGRRKYLFSQRAYYKHLDFKGSTVASSILDFFSVSNLNYLLKRFYRKVIVGMFQYELVAKVLRLKHNVQLLTELPVQSLLNIMTLSLKRKKDASQEVGLR